MANETKKRLWTIPAEQFTFTAGLLAGTVSVKREGVEQAQFDLGKLPAEVVGKLALHGFNQKVKDSIAGLDKKGETAANQVEIMTKVYEQLVEGKWSTRKAAEETMTLRGMVRNILRQELPKKEEASMVELAFKMFGASAVHQPMVEQLREEVANGED